MKKICLLPIFAGVAVGLAALLLTFLGNPANMGFCIACFERDIAGSLGLHAAVKVQYLRPEIPGIVLGAFAAALAAKEFRPKSGSAPAIRFLLGAVVMIGALAFLGCPLRMVLRLAGGDLNALFGLLGFTAGIFVGTRFLNAGFTLKRAYPASAAEGGVLPLLMLGLLALGLFAPSMLRASAEGPGSMHAPFLIALGLAAAVGALAQRSRLCMVGGIRDTMLFGDFNLLLGFAAVFVTVLAGNLIRGSFRLGMAMQPVAHSSTLWNILGMFAVGWGSVLLGGCPLRQLILAAEGNGDSAVTVLGMFAGAALSHNLGLAGNPDSVNEAGGLVVGGISAAGKLAVLLGIAVLLAVSLIQTGKEKAA